MVALEVIDRAARRLAEAAGPSAKVILFGSHARGDAGAHSDLDFLVLKPIVQDRVQEAARLRRALRGLGVAVDVVVMSIEDAESWSGVRNTLAYDALREGRVLAET